MTPEALPTSRLPAFPNGRAVCDTHGGVVAVHADPTIAAKHADDLNREATYDDGSPMATDYLREFRA